jgi:hypothetical protein
MLQKLALHNCDRISDRQVEAVHGTHIFC